MSKVTTDKYAVINTFNKHYSILDGLVLAGVDVVEDRTLFCPFHDNTNTKAAKHYSSSNSIYCFQEGRRYGSYDVYTKLLGYDKFKIYSMVEQFDLEIRTSFTHKNVLSEDLYEEFKKTGDLLRTLINAHNRWRNTNASKSCNI